MAGPFRVLITPAFEREFRAISRKDSVLVRALEELIEILSNDPHNRNGRHKIKKLVGLKAGEGQWRIRWRDYRLRYGFFLEAKSYCIPSAIGKTRIEGISALGTLKKSIGPCAQTTTSPPAPSLPPR
jgi:mRNA-degrading endonuclease RelE of RelBE toxin-antitoxin system